MTRTQRSHIGCHALARAKKAPLRNLASEWAWACFSPAQHHHFSFLSRSISACNSLDWSCSARDFASSSSIFRCRASSSLDCDFSAFAFASNSSTRRCNSISRAVGPAGATTRAGRGSVGVSFTVTPPCPADVGTYTESLCTHPHMPTNATTINPQFAIRNRQSSISFSNKRPVRSTL